MENIIEKPKGCSSKKVGLLTRFRKNNAGNFAIMAAVILPVVCFGGLYGVDSYYRVMKAKKFNEYVMNACHRALKPSRTQLLEDSDRQKTAQKLAEGSFPKSQFDNLVVDTTAGWLTGTVKASASFKPILKLININDVQVQAEYTCNGIPPYPHDDEVLLQSEMSNELGSSLVLTRSNRTRYGYTMKNCWGYMTHETIGWTGSHGWKGRTDVRNDANIVKDSAGNERIGILEVQFWGTRQGYPRSACFSYRGEPPLPVQAPSDYGIELDSNYNNEMWKDIELHPGHYELSFWYFAREFNTAGNGGLTTNGIGAYIEGIRGKNPLKKSPVVCVNGRKADGWRRLTYKFRVDEYNIYRFYVKGETLNDTAGGVFNSFLLTYLDDMNSTQTFHDEETVGNSIYTPYGDCTTYLYKQLDFTSNETM